MADDRRFMHGLKGQPIIALYELRTYTLHVGKMAEAKALSGDRLPGAPEGRAGQEAGRVFPKRYRHNQSTRSSLEIR
jgi:hypothetical protein